MAASFYITDGSNTVYFIGGSSVLELRTNGWNTVSINEDFIWETIELVSDTTDSSVRSTMVTLNKLIHRARDYARNEISSTSVWLYWNADGESVKRSLVLDGSVEILSDEIYSPLMGIDSIKVNLALKRKPFWENTSATADSTTGLSVTGGTWLIGNDAGDFDQRISKLDIDAVSVSKDTYWIGIRPLYEGTTDFESLWEAEFGVADIADTTFISDGTASSGEKAQTTFATSADLVDRFHITIDQLPGVTNYDDFVGRYQVLCRCKVDSGTTQVRIQLRYAPAWNIVYEMPIVQDTFIDGDTNWHLEELGEIQIPPMGDRDGVPSTDLADYSLTLFAERLSVSGSLDVDCFILIPSEYFLKVISSSSPGSGPEVYVTPFGDSYFLGTGAGSADFGPINWGYPLGGGILVSAAEYQGTHTLTGTISLGINLYPRWQSYRA